MGNISAKCSLHSEFNHIHFLLFSDNLQIVASICPKTKEQDCKAHFYSLCRFLFGVGTLQYSNISSVIRFMAQNTWPGSYGWKLWNVKEVKLRLFFFSGFGFFVLLPQPCVLCICGGEVQKPFKENAEELGSQQQQQQEHTQQTKQNHISNKWWGNVTLSDQEEVLYQEKIVNVDMLIRILIKCKI